MITRVIKGFIFEMAIVQRLADPPCQRWIAFDLPPRDCRPMYPVPTSRTCTPGHGRTSLAPRSAARHAAGVPLAYLRPCDLPGRDLIRRIQPCIRQEFVHGVEPGDITDLRQPSDRCLRPHSRNTLQVRPQLAAGSRPTAADTPGQIIRLFDAQLLDHCDFLIERVDPFPPLFEHSNHPWWNLDVGEVIAVKGHGTIRTKVLDQRANEGPVDLPSCPTI